MEPTMTSLRVLSTVGAIALLVPMVATAGFAQNPNGSKANSARGAAVHPGGGVRAGGGGGVHGGGGYHGGYHGGGGGALIGGAIAGAVIGGAIASQGYGPEYYGSPADYNDDGASAGPPPGHDDAMACMQTYRSYDPTYRSYNLQSGTYLGNDGQRHPCP
jgi:BA14K-like protein